MAWQGNAQEAIDVIRSHGLQVDWDGKLHSRIWVCSPDA